MESQGTCQTSQVLGDTGGAESNGCDWPFTSVVGVSGAAFETWRHATVGDRMACASDLLSERVPVAVREEERMKAFCVLGQIHDTLSAMFKQGERCPRKRDMCMFVRIVMTGTEQELT